MTLQAHNWENIPSDTARVARAAFPKGNLYVKMRDELGVLYEDQQFTELFCSSSGQPAQSPAHLAMVTVMQHIEGLSDRQAAEAARSRIDWKYALGLPLEDSGFDASVLSEFRGRLVAGEQVLFLLDNFLSICQEREWVKARGKQRTDSTHVLGSIRQLNRLELVGETMRHSLNILAQVVPDWLVKQSDISWFERYEHRIEQYRLPSSKSGRIELALQMGQDGHHLLEAIYSSEFRETLSKIPAVESLRQIWIQQYQLQGEKLLWRDDKGLPNNHIQITSPYDMDARNRTKRDLNWTGYTAHFTETCDQETVNLITHITTTPATTGDAPMIPEIHQALDKKNLLPQEHWVDTGYVSAANMINSQTSQGIELLGPIPPDTSWQAQDSNRFPLPTFAIDWESESVTCPMGKQSISWKPDRHSRGHPIIRVSFSSTDCKACSRRTDCTQAKTHPRVLNLKPQAEHEVLQEARQSHNTPEFRKRYALRAGVEGTISQVVRGFDLRRSPYIGLAKTHLHHVAIATGTNITRLVAWLNGKTKAATRITAFRSLKPSISA
jgi:transposase